MSSHLFRQLIRPCLQQPIVSPRLFSSSPCAASRTPLYNPSPNFHNMIPNSPKIEPEELLTKDMTPEEANIAKWREYSRIAYGSLRENPVPDAYSGRAVRISPTQGVLAAFSKLNKIMQTNSIRREFEQTKRHEKKGVKRRRLASETWRRVFAHEVRRSVQLVSKIRSRGA